MPIQDSYTFNFNGSVCIRLFKSWTNANMIIKNNLKYPPSIHCHSQKSKTYIAKKWLNFSLTDIFVKFLPIEWNSANHNDLKNYLRYTIGLVVCNYVKTGTVKAPYDKFDIWYNCQPRPFWHFHLSEKHFGGFYCFCKFIKKYNI